MGRANNEVQKGGAEMKIGVTLRNMGPQSTPDWMLRGAQAADSLGFESLWVTDHIAIPPDDAEGSGGRYLDPLVSLAWLAQATTQIRLGTGVLILPYRAALPTAKQIATVAELSGNRLELGVGIGWMDAEFNALGLSRHSRGRLSDNILASWHQWFGEDPAKANGQPFLFRPKPPKPKIWIGGRAPHALKRALTHGDGWLPMAQSPEQLAPDIARYHELHAQAPVNGGPPAVTVMTSLPLATDQRDDALQRLHAYAELGIERIVCAIGYNQIDQYLTSLENLCELKARFGKD